VARKLGVTAEELIAANKLKGNALRVGQELTIEGGSANSKTPVARVITPDSASAERFVTRDPTIALPPIPPPERRSKSLDGGRHTVRNGETLWSIARSYGVSVEALAAENSLSSHSRISKGQKLWIPRLDYDGAATLAANSDRADTIQRITYVVRVGDTLSHIAATFRVRMADLLKWNKLNTGDAIKAGQKLVMYVNDTRRSGG
jgi:membrane-bound lytic murein transglycosylase D